MPHPFAPHIARSIPLPALQLTLTPAAFLSSGSPTRRVRARSAWVRAALLVGGLILSGCATLPGGGQPPSHALERPQATTLGRALSGLALSHPGQSGFHLLEFGPEALAARLALVDAAERTIDVQYYIYDDDPTGDLLIHHLLQAADRGVRVRILLDDYNLRHAAKFASLCAAPQFEVRVFNPVAFRPRWGRLLQYAVDFKRLNRRMHDKLLAVDNAAVILGGRNVGDDYFDLTNKHGFRDFDLLAAGDITRQASDIFDAYWNSRWAVPVTNFERDAATPAALAAVRGQITARVRGVAPFVRQYEATRDGYLADLERGDTLIWAPGEILADPPGHVAASLGETSLIARRLEAEWRATRQEALIEAAYFVPGKDGMAAYRDMRQRGVAVTVLTNTLATTDVPIVYFAYERYRRPLLENGVELFEYKRNGAGLPEQAAWYRPKQVYDILHSKIMVFDRQRVWVGSFNLDPRSTHLNLEITALIDSKRLAEEAARAILRDCAPDQSWGVHLEPRSCGAATSSGDTRLVWTGESRGKPAVRRHEPVSWLQELKSFFVLLLPGMEKQL